MKWLSIRITLFIVLSSIIAQGQSVVFDSALAAKGGALYERLRHDNPDAAPPADAEIPPHTVHLDLSNSISRLLVFDLAMPEVVWNHLTQNERRSLVAFVLSEIQRARMRPELFALTNASAPIHADEIDNIRYLADNDWIISVGHLVQDGYLTEDRVVLKGSDRNKAGASIIPIIVYADSKSDPVYNSSSDRSVSQVESYHKNSAPDLKSIKYSAWTNVTKSSDGYEVSVTFTCSESGNFVLREQTFNFDSYGVVLRVKDNSSGSKD